MTDTEWLACTDTQRMLEFLRKASGRKLQLLACACLRPMWHLLDDERIRRAILVAERLADGGVSDEEAMACDSAAEAAFLETEAQDDVLVAYFGAATVLNPDVHYAAVMAAGCAADVRCWGPLAGVAEKGPCELIRDVFPPPSRPAASSRSWRVPGVLALAETLYDHHAFDRMPELADVLEEAGCTDADVLAHCRRAGPHVRGCWVVDLILGKQ